MTTTTTAAPSAPLPSSHPVDNVIYMSCMLGEAAVKSVGRQTSDLSPTGRQAVTRAIKHFKEQPANLKWLNKAIKHRPFGDPLSNMIPSPTSYRMMTISWEKQQNRNNNNNNNTVYDTIDWVTLPSWSHSVCHPLLRKRGSK